MIDKKIANMLMNAEVGSEVEINGHTFEIECNTTGCFRAILKDVKPKIEDKAFFTSRVGMIQTLENSLKVTGYHDKIMKSLEQARLDLLTFIEDKKLLLFDNTIETGLDFDGDVYYIQISHGENCPSYSN